MPKTLLIVEDDYGVRETLREALEIEGYSVLSANNGKEGLDVLQANQHINLVLLDLTMPIMNGREFLDRIAITPELKSTRVLVLSAVADRQSTHGALGFIKKPVDLNILLLTIEKFIDK